MITKELLEQAARELKEQTGIEATYLRMPLHPEAEKAGREFGFAPFSPLDESMRDERMMWMVR